MAPTLGLNISDDQRFALMKFRRSVSDCLKAHHDDHFLLRWLRARNWNPEAAEKMLRESLKWREQWKADEIDTWEPCEVLRKYYPYGLSGFDKEGSPIIVVPFSGLDIVGMVHSVQRSDFIRNTIKTLEKMLKLAEAQSEEYGVEARKLVVVLDMEGFTLKQYAWRPAGELVVALVKMYEANYPEILKDAYIVNAPRVFSVGFAIIKNFLNDYTISKIHIYKNEPKKWKPILLQHIDPSQLPVHFGGTMTDENGDPKCSSKICQGGKIPKSYYRDKNATDPTEEEDRKNYVTSEVRSGGKLYLDFDMPTAGCILKWEFHTEQHDINFGVVRLETNGREVEEVPLRRVKCQSHDEIGVVTSNCQTKFLNLGNLLPGSRTRTEFSVCSRLHSRSKFLQAWTLPSLIRSRLHRSIRWKEPRASENSSLSVNGWENIEQMILIIVSGVNGRAVAIDTDIGKSCHLEGPPPRRRQGHKNTKC